MAELENIAKHRAERLQEIKDWSVTEKREERKAKAEAERLAAMEEVAGTTVWLEPQLGLKDRIKVTMIVKPIEDKRSWISRLFGRK